MSYNQASVIVDYIGNTNRFTHSVTYWLMQVWIIQLFNFKQGLLECLSIDWECLDILLFMLLIMF